MFRLLVLAIALASAGGAAALSPLEARGYAVLPTPQQVALRAGELRFGPGWRLDSGGVPANDPAVRSLAELLESRFHIALRGNGTGTVRLALAPGSVTPGAALDRDTAAIAAQAYRIELTPRSVTITANAAPGLFYGVETLVQLLKPRGGALWLPEGTITDWPDLRLRQIYWDDAHHLERLPALEDAVRQAAFYKINGFVIKLDGHFQYRSAPAVVEPEALSAAELQRLTDYAARYHVQLIPYLDSPAHIAFILKHPEYAPLRSFPASNYEICAVNPASYDLLFGMYRELIDATRGSQYFYLSTDEAYYIGMAATPACNEAARAKELGSRGKLLAEFITKAANFIHDRGRTVIFWGEYPLRPEDIAALPSHLVNGEVYGPQFDPVYKAHGIRQTIYTYTQAEERHFPEYFLLPPERRLHPARRATPRIEQLHRSIALNPARKNAELFGVVNAGWADSGLHPETFWLGYAAGTAAAWNPTSPGARESMSDFYPLFYGWGTENMDRLYSLMSTQAQFWWDSWENGPSQARKPIFGSHNRIFTPPHPAQDQFLPLPPAPGENLAYSSTWRSAQARRLQLAAGFLAENDEVTALLQSNVKKAAWNRYNLEVYLSVARLCRHNLEMLAEIGRMDGLLADAAAAAANQQPAQAVRAADQALALAPAIRDRRNAVLGDLTATWYKSWRPRVASANGRTFLHELDDVKDHPADRTVDLSYLIQRELLLPFGDWVNQIRAARNRYAAAHGIAAANGPFDWKTLAVRQ